MQRLFCERQWSAQREEPWAGYKWELREKESVQQQRHWNRQTWTAVSRFTCFILWFSNILCAIYWMCRCRRCADLWFKADADRNQLLLISCRNVFECRWFGILYLFLQQSSSQSVALLVNLIDILCLMLINILILVLPVCDV